MAKELIPEGTYTARVMDYWLEKTSKGGLSVKIQFKAFKNEERTQYDTVKWSGSLNEGKPRDMALKALYTCGFQRLGKLRELTAGNNSGALDMAKDVSIKVTHADFEDKDKKITKYAQVAWINEVGANRYGKAISAEEFDFLSAPMGLEVDLERVAQDMGVKPKSDYSDIPF